MGSGAAADRARPAVSGDEPLLAAAWLAVLGAITARAGHEINNALNGAVMNLEVVRLRARPGTDGAAGASFATTAAAELERASGLVGSLVALARAPRPEATPDVAEVVGQVAALLEGAFGHQQVTLQMSGARRGLFTAAPLAAVRLAVGAAFLGASDAVATAALAEEPAAEDPASGPARLVRCTLDLAMTPTLRLSGEIHGVGRTVGTAPFLDAAIRAALHVAGVTVLDDAGALVVHFPSVE